MIKERWRRKCKERINKRQMHLLLLFLFGVFVIVVEYDDRQHVYTHKAYCKYGTVLYWIVDTINDMCDHALLFCFGCFCYF